MDASWIRFSNDMIGRLTGPMKFRLVLQPLMASFFAVRSGLADARTGTSPYLWSLVAGTGSRAATIHNGWKSIGRVFILAVVLDVVYQLYELRFVYPLQAIVVAIILAILPYVILRGLTTRLAQLSLRHEDAEHISGTPSPQPGGRRSV